MKNQKTKKSIREGRLLTIAPKKYSKTNSVKLSFKKAINVIMTKFSTKRKDKFIGKKNYLRNIKTQAAVRSS